MTGEDRLRVVVMGATGALGTELISVLDERRFPAGDLIPVATERSMGNEIEFSGDSYPVLTEVPRLAATDLMFLCTPPAPSLESAREALRAGVPCFDLSGALAAQPDVPLVVLDLAGPGTDLSKPLVATPTGAAAAVALAVAPLARVAGLRRVVATALEPASGAGHQGVESLSREVMALFNQEAPPDPETFGRPVAFDCLPAVGEVGGDGVSECEQVLARDLRRLLERPELQVAATVVRVPIFHGRGISVAVELDGPLSPADAAAALEKAPGVALETDPRGPSTRASIGDDQVRVGRLRSAGPAALQLWVVVDVVHQSAVNAVRLAEARLNAG
ncbi:MAG: Asd/ArgC dimerization domain-containing protein [Myxococcota bacterium]